MSKYLIVQVKDMFIPCILKDHFYQGIEYRGLFNKTPVFWHWALPDLQLKYCCVMSEQNAKEIIEKYVSLKLDKDVNILSKLA